MTTTFATQPTATQTSAIAHATMIAELQLAKAQELSIKKHINSPEVLAAVLNAIVSNYSAVMESAMIAERGSRKP